MSKPFLAITMGDPAGIGPEIIIKALRRSDILEKISLIVIADESVIRREAERQGFSHPILKIENIAPDKLEDGDFFLMDPIDRGCSILDAVTKRAPTAVGGKAAAACILKAVELAKAEKVDGIVTAPISKEALHKAGYPYPGHTEFLAELTRTKHFAMMLSGGGLRVIPVTTHLALAAVSTALTSERILSNLRVLHDWLGRFITPNPRIAVCALNPHAGDGGIFGNEEKEKIEPAVCAAQKEGIQAEGPFPADALFARVKKEGYDAVVAMYHDQALIPIKMAAFGEAVNVTIGLPVIRTSVDHGTAYNIAGKNRADPTSLLNAIRLAADLSRISLNIA